MEKESPLEVSPPAVPEAGVAARSEDGAQKTLTGPCALILGVSSGFGAATARALARAGLHILGVHLDRRSGMAAVLSLQEELRASGVQAHFFNVNAADPDKRQGVVAELETLLGGLQGPGELRVLMHSLAFGTLKPLIGATARDSISAAQISMTLEVMASSLVYWTQDLVAAGLIRRGGRIFAMTSGGDVRVIPSYGAVSAAKAALDAYVRQLAVELAPRGITVNALRAGVSNTPALQRIPGSERLLEGAAARNPSGRLTRPEDVADAIVALTSRGTDWITGNVINVDGGEEIVA